MNVAVPVRLSIFSRTKSSLAGKIAAKIADFVRAAAGWVPLSLAGLMAWPGIASLFYYIGMKRADSVVLGMAGCGLFLALVGMMSVVLTSIYVRLRLAFLRPTETLRLEAGALERTGLTLGWVHWNPLLKIDLTWEHPLDVSINAVSRGGRLVEEATAGARAWTDEIIRRVRISDVLGLSRITFRVKHAQSIRILPNRGRAEELEILAQHKPGEGIGHPDGTPDGDLIDARKYGPGDPLKLVLWKVYARSGRMLVRTPERAVAPCDKILSYLVAGPSDERSAELARTALETGRLGNDFLFGADGSNAIATTIPGALELIAGSVNARTSGGEGFASFLNKGMSRGVRSCVVFAPAQAGTWIGAVAAGIRSFDGRVAIIIGADAHNIKKPVTGLRRLLVSDSAAGGSLDELRKIAFNLTGVGARVTILNAATGERINVSLDR